MRAKWVFIDESGAGAKSTSSTHDYFALTAVAVEDPHAARAALLETIRQLTCAFPGPDVQRVAGRGFFHASDDSCRVRRLFLSSLSTLSFECKAAILTPGCPQGKTPYDRLFAALFAEMLPPGRLADEMHVVVALQNAQTTGKVREQTQLLSAVRGYLEQHFSSLAGHMPAKRSVTGTTPACEPCLQLPDYCGWAIQRCLRRREHEWLETLRPQGPGWGYDECGRFVFPPDGSVYMEAGEICGLDFACLPSQHL